MQGMFEQFVRFMGSGAGGNATSTGGLTVFIKDLLDKQFPVQGVNEGTTVAQLKGHIFQYNGIRVQDQILVNFFKLNNY